MDFVIKNVHLISRVENALPSIPEKNFHILDGIFFEIKL